MTAEYIAEHLKKAQDAVDRILDCERYLDQLILEDALKRNSIFPPAAEVDDSLSQVESATDKRQPQAFRPYPDNYGAIIGKRIKEKREEAGITQVKLSEITGIKRPNIARLEKGERLPNLATLVTISEGLSVPVDEFLKNQ